jgi:hypothetical protein
MAKLTRLNSLNALVEDDPTFSAGSNRFSIGVTSKGTGVSYHLHFTEAEAQRFAAFISERVELTRYQSMR